MEFLTQETFPSQGSFMTRNSDSNDTNAAAGLVWLVRAQI